MHPRNYQYGFTLIELMVALTLGLLVTLVVTQAYIGGVGTQQAQTSVSRAQEAARFAFDALAHALRQAGYKNPKAPGTGFCSSGSNMRLVVRNGDQHTTINPAASDLSGTTVTLVNKSDVIRVRYFGEGLTYSPFTTDGSITDCQGNSIAADTLVEDTFYVKADGNNANEPTLFCYSSNTGTEAALIPGVESLQILYGEDTNTDTVIDRYVMGDNVSNANNVRSAMISIVTRTQETPAVDRSGRAYNHFGTNYAPAGAAPTGDSGSVLPASATADGRIRLLTTTTIAVRNVCPL